MTNKITVELLVVDPVVCQIAQHVQLLLWPVQLEEVGIEWDQVMGDDSHRCIQTDLITEGTASEAGWTAQIQNVERSAIIQDIFALPIPAPMVRIHDHGESRQSIALLDFKAAILETRLNLFHDLVLQLQVWSDELVLHQVQSSEQLVVVESQDVVSDVFALVPRKGVLEHAICVKFGLLHASTEEPQPLLTQLERVKLVAQVVLRHILQEVLEPSALKVFMDI